MEEKITDISVKPKAKTRYALLDELRGFLVVCMIVYHWLLSLYDIFGWQWAGFLFDAFTYVEAFFAGAFILLSGFMCGLSRSNLRRGAICFSLALLVTLGTVLAAPYLGRIEIFFGILHLLGFSMLFCGAFNFILKRINPWIGLIVNGILFFVTYGIPVHQTDLIGARSLIPTAWSVIPWLFPLGITTDSFYSADYFPIIPWMFLFLCGYYLYRFHFVERLEKVFKPSRIPPLSFLGRHALVIYIVHQPLIYLITLPFVG